MKIIGVTGKPGTGKTEFSCYLGEKDSVGVIHVDKLLNVAKERYFGAFLEKQDKVHSEERSPVQHLKIKGGVKKFFFSNKILFSAAMKFVSFLVRRPMLDKIEEFRKAGKEMVIIDDWSLNTHRYLKDKLNAIYVIQRPYISRRTALRDRDDLTIKEAKICDIPFALNFYKVPKGKNVTVLNNEGTLEEWHSQAEKVYERFHIKTFDEKYRLQKGHEVKVRSLNEIAIGKVEKLPQLERERTAADFIKNENV